MTALSPQVLAFQILSEEQWPSIELCAEMLREHLPDVDASRPQWDWHQPAYRSVLGSLPAFGKTKLARTLDRSGNRLWFYPRQARKLASSSDLFHVCDHSYSQLIHALPTGRCGVLCQDLDTYRCLLEPEREPRSSLFRLMTRHILRGFQRAALVFYTTEHVRSQIEKYQLVDPARLVHAPLGIAPEFLAAKPQSSPPLPNGVAPPYLLHVGSCIARKRVDVLLRVFHAVRQRRPDVRLVKVGGPFEAAHEALIRELGIRDGIVFLSGLTREALAGLYQQASLTLVPSEREGFGLPVIEALACGSPVLANDIPPLREGGGMAAKYLPIAEVDRWVEQILQWLSHPDRICPRDVRERQGRSFRWERHARAISDAYQALWERIPSKSNHPASSITVRP